MLREVLVDDRAEPVGFVNTVNLATPIREVTAAIRREIGLSVDQQLQARDRDDLFKLIRGAIEQARVFVLQVGDLGSYHSTIHAETFRGYAVADNHAPFIVINDNDAKSAHTFTLLHELTHVFAGSSGISSETAFTVQDRTPPIEQFCNAVAAEVLMPEGRFRETWLGADAVTLPDKVQELANLWNVSRAAVAYRLLRLAQIPRGQWQALHQQYVDEWREQRQREREIEREREGGPSYYVVRRSKLGHGLLSTVKTYIDSGVLTYTRASKILGVKPVNVGSLLSS